jgi:hypothetical protein
VERHSCNEEYDVSFWDWDVTPSESAHFDFNSDGALTVKDCCGAAAKKGTTVPKTAASNFWDALSQ